MQCHTPDWIDGTGTVHCDCAARNIFDLRFQCATNNEAASFSNYLDLRKTLTAINLAMEAEGLDEDELDALEDWIGEMTKKIKEEARKRWPS